MILNLAADEVAGSGGIGVGGVAGAIAAVAIALITALSKGRKDENGDTSSDRKKRAKLQPEPAPAISAAESAANLNFLNLQKMLDADRLSFERYRAETEQSENSFRRQVAAEISNMRAEIEWRDNIIQQIEEELITVQSGVLTGDFPPFPPRKPRPPRPAISPFNPPAATP